MRARIALTFVVVGLIISMTGLSAPRRAVAQESVGEGQAQTSAQQDQTAAEDVESPEVNDYLWIAGSSFKPRASNIDYQYMGNGCITSLTGGSALKQSFTAPFRVPDGSVVRGVRFYFYDTSAQFSRLSITSYDGAGNYTDHILVDSTGAAGDVRVPVEHKAAGGGVDGVGRVQARVEVALASRAGRVDQDVVGVVARAVIRGDRQPAKLR